MKYICGFLIIFFGIVVSALGFHAGDPGSIPQVGKFQINFFSSFCCNHQTFLIRLATFKITQILSPEKISDRKGMSTVEQCI